jgi:hypothetical protein
MNDVLEEVNGPEGNHGQDLDFTELDRRTSKDMIYHA